MLRSRRIQIFACKRPSIARLRVVVLETEHPLTRGSFGSAFPNRSLNFTNRTQIAIHLSQVHEARLSRVSVRVDKPGNHSSTFRFILFVLLVANSCTFSFVPTATKRPPATATASARGRRSLMVMMLPFRSTQVQCALEAATCLVQMR